MITKILSITFISFTIYAGSNVDCRSYYSKVEQSLTVETRETKNSTQKSPAEILKSATDSEVFFPMFTNAFETEFGIQMIVGHKEVYRKMIFEPESLTNDEWQVIRSGTANKVKVGNEFFAGSPIKAFLAGNHLIVDKQEKRAEEILTNLRQADIPLNKRKRIQLDQLELVALRTANIIGRDFDLFVGTPMEKSPEEIRKMKFRFLSVFEFNGKTLSDTEMQALYDAKVIIDDPLADTRFDLAQSYDPKYVTKEMIQARNQLRLRQIQEWKSKYRADKNSEARSDEKSKAALEELNQTISSDKELLSSMRWMRKAVAKAKSDGVKFDSKENFEEWLNTEHAHLSAGLAKLKEAGVDDKLDVLVEGIQKNSTYKAHVKKLQAKLNKDVPEEKLLLDFIHSSLGERMFAIAKERVNHVRIPIYKRLLKVFKVIEPTVDKELTVREMKKGLKAKLEEAETLMKLKEERPDLFEATFNNKLVRTSLNEVEVNEVFNILTYSSGLRPLWLILFDPLSKFGFCFGRAFFANLLLRHHGVHKDSIKKVFIYGPMKGGLFGWGFHVATMVAKEGGGFWVLDPSHGEPQTLDVWFKQYEKASKDGRIKIDIADGERFGRSGFGTPDWQNLESQYDSVLNKTLGPLGLKFKYFKDNMARLTRNNFDKQDKNLLREGFDQALDILNIGL